MSHQQGNGVEPSPQPRENLWSVGLELGALIWLYYLLVVVCVAVPPFFVPTLGWQLNFREGTAVTFGCTVIANVIALCLLTLWARRKGLHVTDLGWGKAATWTSLVAALVIAVAYASFTMGLPQLRENATEISWFKLWGAGCSLFVAGVEEIVFRGYMLTRLARSGASRTSQVLISGIAFGVVHMAYGLWAIVMTLLLGIALAWLYLLGRRSLTAPIVCHGAINVIIEPWLLLYTIELYAEMFASG